MIKVWVTKVGPEKVLVVQQDDKSPHFLTWDEELLSDLVQALGQLDYDLGHLEESEQGQLFDPDNPEKTWKT